MTNYARFEKKIQCDINTEKHLKSKDKLKTEVFCLTGKLLLGLIFIGVSSFAVFSTVKLQMFSDRNFEIDIKRDVQKREDSNYDNILLKLLLGKQKRNVQGETTTKTTIFDGIKNLLSRKLGKNLPSLNVNVGVRQDQQLQQCEGSQFKRTFPDIDYAFFGYNILFGYPLANGHDPGFTYPIFEAEYNEGRKTSDCRYKVPNGLVVVPDVSCVTSFSSTTIQNKYEFSKALSVSANVNGNGYGVSFSASAGYKKSSSEIATGESVKIISTAKCSYYFSKISEEHIPRFTKEFVAWVKKLDKADDNETYIDFLNKYGTHYLTYTTFGARFTYENTMTSKTFNKKQEQGVNVAIQASYSGMFSAGAGFNMDSSQKSDASDFQKSVTTKTIAVGATPPVNGDAMEWASGVKDNPVPMEYKLEPIRHLFRKSYMRNLNVNVEIISKQLNIAESKYCKYQKNLGKLDSCDPIEPGLILAETKIIATYNKRLPVASFTECLDICDNYGQCSAISFCKECKTNSNEYNTCFMMYGGRGETRRYSAIETTNTAVRWDSVVFDFKIPHTTVLHFKNTALKGISRLSSDLSRSTFSNDQCLQHCINDAHCVAFSFCGCRSRMYKCKTYAKQRMNGLKKDIETTTYFMPKYRRYAARFPTTGSGRMVFVNKNEKLLKNC